MATGVNGAAGAFGTGPSTGYILILFLFIGFLAMLTGNVENAKTIITYLLLFSRLIWIKFNMNMPKFLTIQKPDRHFSVSGFAAALKPEPFDGSFYKRWRSRMILWLIAMNCYQVA
jgi:hypothetical protein